MPGDKQRERHERRDQQLAPGHRELVGHNAVAVGFKQVEQREPDARATLELLVVVLVLNLYVVYVYEYNCT